jgi:hypothetical protein
MQERENRFTPVTAEGTVGNEHRALAAAPIAAVTAPDDARFERGDREGGGVRHHSPRCRSASWLPLLEPENRPTNTARFSTGAEDSAVAGIFQRKGLFGSLRPQRRDGIDGEGTKRRHHRGDEHDEEVQAGHRRDRGNIK